MSDCALSASFGFPLRWRVKHHNPPVGGYIIGGVSRSIGMTSEGSNVRKPIGRVSVDHNKVKGLHFSFFQLQGYKWPGFAPGRLN